MKTHVPPSVIFIISLCCPLAATAQVIQAPTHHSISDEAYHQGTPSFASDKFLSGILQIPTVEKTSGSLAESTPVFVSQDTRTLGTRTSSAKPPQNTLDLTVLQETSAYRSANRVKVKVSDEQATGISVGLAALSAAYQKPSEAVTECKSLATSIRHRLEVDISKVLEVVEAEIAANPNCSCEIVKTAIITSRADAELVGNIAEVAISANPSAMRLISQCAIAALPEALPQIQAVLAKLDPNSGESSYSAKDAKSGKDAKDAKDSVASVTPPEDPGNPLDRPFISFPPPLSPQPPVTNPNPDSF